MTTNTKSAHERTASIDLAQLDEICQSWKTGVISGQAAMMDIAGLLARRSLTSGAPAGLLSADELAALRRLEEVWTDGEGYDVPKAMMQRLAEIGVIRRTSGSFYQATEFGMRVLAQPVHDAAAPVEIEGLGRMTNEDDGYLTLQFKDEDAACAFMQKYGCSVEVDDMPPMRDAAAPTGEKA